MREVAFQQLQFQFQFQSYHYRTRFNSRASGRKDKCFRILRFKCNSDTQHRHAYSNSHYSPNILTFIPQAASSSAPIPVSGSGTGEHLLDAKAKRQKKKKRIAGIDQDELLDPKLLADPDSCFCEFQGVHIHYKLYQHQHDATDRHQPPQTQTHALGLDLPIILLHGFGASLFSWSRVMKPLAQITASKVVAFDRPAFGLTSRPTVFVSSSLPTSATDNSTKSLNPYSMAFSTLATLFFIDFLAADKAVLVGHSAGSLVAVNSYFEAPERIAALILVAPAIFAPCAIHKIPQGNKLGRDKQTEGDGRPSIKLFAILSKFVAFIAQPIMQMVKGMSDMLNSLYKKALSAVLRSALGVMLIRMVIDIFGITAVRKAWYDANQVTEHILSGYTKPLKAKGWDKALAEFTAATLASPESESKPPLSKRLHKISCPGENDLIVPSWNAKRISQAIPGSCLEVIKHCGHLPHEEKVEEFVSVVLKFLQKAFGDSEELSLQAVI